MKIRDLSAWEAFYWVASEHSFTAAAAKMKIGVPLLSRRISSLEGELGVRLFHRSTRKVSLTDEGRGLLPLLTSVLEDLRGLESRFEDREEPAGTIRITSTPAIAHRILAPLLIEFSNQYPKVRLELDLSRQVIDLIAAQMDLAIRIDEPTPSELIYKRLGPNPLVFCASPEYLKRTKHPLRTLADLRRHPVLTSEVHNDCRVPGQPGKLGDYVPIQPIVVEDALLLSHLAISGAGVGIRSRWDVAEALADGKLVEVLKKYRIEDFAEVYAVIPSRRYLAPRVRKLIDFISQRWPK